MKISAKVIRHSISEKGHEIATLQVTGHRFILPEQNTHREISKNVASNRAIPVRKLLAQVIATPAIPVFWGRNQPGMQAREELSPDDTVRATDIWLSARDSAVRHAREMEELGVHKQITNRLLETFSWYTAILTSTQWANLLSLRTHPDAQPEFQALAGQILIALNGSTPSLVRPGEWHLPYVSNEEIKVLGWEVAIKCSVARSARVSYLTHEGTVPSLAKDLELYESLVLTQPAHASPSEHQATPTQDRSLWGNFKNWGQHRKTIPTEYNGTFEKLIGWGKPR